MIIGLSYILILLLIIGPALVGIKELKELRDSGGGLSSEERWRVGKLFGPLAFAVLLLFVYLAAMVILLTRSS
jgi:hypothetical protein